VQYVYIMFIFQRTKTWARGLAALLGCRTVDATSPTRTASTSSSEPIRGRRSRQADLEDEDVDEDDNEDADDLEGEEENEVLLRASNHIFFLICYFFCGSGT
jgi:hypothetical protein